MGRRQAVEYKEQQSGMPAISFLFPFLLPSIYLGFNNT
jgi:hypothetical protein